MDRDLDGGLVWLRMPIPRALYHCLERVAARKRTTVLELAYLALARELPRSYRPRLYPAPRPGEGILDDGSAPVVLVLTLPFAVYFWLFAEACRRERSRVPLVFESRLYAAIPWPTRRALFLAPGSLQ